MNVQRRLSNAEKHAEAIVIQADDDAVPGAVPFIERDRYKYGRKLLREGTAPDEVRSTLLATDIVRQATPDVFWLVRIRSVAEPDTQASSVQPALVDQVLKLLGVGAQTQMEATR